MISLLKENDYIMISLLKKINNYIMISLLKENDYIMISLLKKNK